MKKLGAGLLWAILLVIFFSLITVPVSMQAHLVFTCFVILMMVTLKTLRVEGAGRIIVISLGMSVILRYAYWRTTSTLPPVNQLENFIPAIMLYSAEMYGIGMLCLGLFVVANLPEPRICPEVPDDELPTIDVYVPTYNEDKVMLATTLAAAKSMEYPPGKVTVWLLDDGGTDQKCNAEDAVTSTAARERRAELTKLCEELGVRYITRERNVHAKAGNMNNALEHSSSELLVIFDADHAPARNFLKETIGLFSKDEKLFLVQTPHFFINPDPVERNLGTFNTMPSENEMFNNIILQGLDKWNAVFFCGSAAVLRRVAVESNGGFSHNTITEDCETALNLHSRGWRSAYVGKPLIAGLQPETYANFIGQQSRWGQGMLQIMMFYFPPLKSGLTLAQRLCYTSSGLYWLFPLPRTLFLISPLLFIFLNLKIFVISGAEFLAYVIPYMIVNLLIQNYLYGKRRWPWVSDLYEYIQIIYLLPAIISVVMNPRKPSFRVTAKNEVQEEDRISEIGMPFFLLYAVFALTFIVSVVTVFMYPHMLGLMIAVGGWNVLNLVIAGGALGVVSERRNLRRTHRVNIERRCEITLESGTAYAGTIEDVSIGGSSIRIAGAKLKDVPKGSMISVSFEMSDHKVSGPLPMIVRGGRQVDGVVHIGCEFNVTQTSQYFLISDLVFANSDKWQKFQNSRAVDIGLLRGTLWFIRIALYQTGRGFAFLLSKTKPSSTGAKS
ncbi:UDP-forming cellulose synthase catalytic subunit [Pseudochelatococcus contaminans]|uniref:Cellulose synthase catalytic subunit [UDP-forming] n=1 Tax=Pseudochelatococcus contaminans TaxID=1538103 RepID=A0A7W6EGU1_9HYPH|nr:UDP-forming cellulose synthase catalytic subunit [Pseudochelatococcus contaminans]MBB3809630.1 cellulose synthase (UDP-forming) [Pseudochelatococcus contaminans]